VLAAAMSAKWTDTATIDVGADPVLFSASELHSAPLPGLTGGLPGPPSGSPDSETSQLAWNREDLHLGPSRRSSLFPVVLPLPPLPPDASRTPTPPPPPPPREPFIWPSTQPEPEPEPEPVPVPEPAGVAVGSPPESGAIARQRSTRSRRTGSTSTVGDMSIDWIVPESSTTPGRFKGIGTAPIRMTQTPTSAAVVRSSVAIERQEEPPREGGGLGGSGGGGSRRERARRDSGVLGVDDLARVRRSMQAMI
jgi:hypothetical protein